MKTKPEIKNIKEIGESRLFTIQQLSLQFSNGENAVYERIKAKAGKAVMIAAVTTQQEIILVREYAAGTERYELQLPKGIVEDGEESLAAANRELSEETGFAADTLKILQTIRVSPGYFDHQTDLVLATGLYQKKLQTGDEPEDLEVIKHPLAEIESLLQREDFSESRSIAGVLLVMREMGI